MDFVAFFFFGSTSTHFFHFLPFFLFSSFALFFFVSAKLPKAESDDSFWSPREEYVSIKRELDTDSAYGDISFDFEREIKRPLIERRKSVRFADEVDSALERIYPIPVKEETWPYGSLSGEMFPKAFPEFCHLYSSSDKACDMDLSNFVGVSDEKEEALPVNTCTTADMDLACFDDVRSCVGMSFLMMDGSIARGVCATSQGLWGKKFLRHEMLVNLGYLSNTDDIHGVRAADYLETDMYMRIDRSEVASVCRILCADADIPTSANNNGTLTALTATEHTHSGKKTKAFFYAWYYSSTTKSIYPYLADGTRRVSVFWPEDRTWYEGKLDQSVDNGLHRVIYDCDGSEEMVNLLQLREQGCLRFLN